MALFCTFLLSNIDSSLLFNYRFLTLSRFFLRAVYEHARIFEQAFKCSIPLLHLHASFKFRLLLFLLSHLLPVKQLKNYYSDTLLKQFQIKVQLMLLASIRDKTKSLLIRNSSDKPLVNNSV